MQTNDFSVKSEYYTGKKEQRKKAIKVAGIVLLISAIIAALSVLFLFFEEKPYGLEDVLWSICLSIGILFISFFLFFFLKETFSFIKEGKKKKTLPLSPAEMKKQNIVSSEDYADWLNDYLAGCFRKKLTPYQLKVLAESYNVYYHPTLDIFNYDDTVVYYTQRGKEFSSARYVRGE